MEAEKRNYIFTQLEMMSEITSGKQKEYYQHQLDCAELIECVSVYEVLSEEEISRIKKTINPQPKECYRNAARLAMLFPDRIEYVEGLYGVMGVFGTEHAWNRIGNKYIDITAELVLKKDVKKEDYVKLMVLSSKEITDLVLKENCYTWFFDKKYLNSIKFC